MYVVLVRRWIRALTVASVLAIGLATLAVPAATPAEAAGLPDVVVVGGTDLTQHLSGPVLTHLFYVNVQGDSSVAAGKLSAVVTFPSGVQPNGRTLITGPEPWDCTFQPTVMICKNRFEIKPGLGATRFRIELTVPAPITGNVVSTADLGNLIAESNEGNNQVVTTYHFVP